MSLLLLSLSLRVIAGGLRSIRLDGFVGEEYEHFLIRDNSLRNQRILKDERERGRENQTYFELLNPAHLCSRFLLLRQGLSHAMPSKLQENYVPGRISRRQGISVTGETGLTNICLGSFQGFGESFPCGDSVSGFFWVDGEDL